MACLFCDIISGTESAIRVFEDDATVAFLDIRPVSRGHTLVVPRTHATDLTDLSPTAGGQLFRTGQQLARAMRVSDLRSDATNLIVNDGRAAFQTVFHAHLHVVPRWEGDKLSFAKGLVVRKDPHREQTGAMIRDGLARLAAEDASRS